MMDLIDKTAALIKANGGRVVGKTRLQKISYLLEEMRLGVGTTFDYHNYGPFSAELAFAADDAESLGYICTEQLFGTHEVPYTVFTTNDDAPEFNDKAADKRREALELMKSCSALALEIAATAVYLKLNGYPDDCWDEVERRKPLKATDDRLKRARELVDGLGL
jgi:uncharacterized protein YwgA